MAEQSFSHDYHAAPGRALELLAPAKNLEVGTAALMAGADAIYIGGSGFGARAAAGSSCAPTPAKHHAETPSRAVYQYPPQSFLYTYPYDTQPPPPPQ